MLPLMHSTFVTTSTSWHVAGHDELLELLESDDNELLDSELLLEELDDKLLLELVMELDDELLLDDGDDKLLLELLLELELLDEPGAVRIHHRRPGIPSCRSITTCVPSEMKDPS